jgi:hypothetical protein
MNSSGERPMRDDASGLRREAGMRRVVAILAVLFGALGLAVLFFGSKFGLPADTCRVVGSVLLLAALGDALVLLFWDRIVCMRH